MIVCKAGTYPNEEPFRCSTIGQAPGLAKQTTDQAGKACYGQTLKLITEVHKLRTKKFITLGTWALEQNGGQAFEAVAGGEMEERRKLAQIWKYDSTIDV